MRVLVTGGGGYLGCEVVAQLLEKGHEVRVLDRFCFGEAPLASIPSAANVDVRHGDLRRLQEAAGLFDGLDAIIHLAGLSNDPSCDLNPDMAGDVNVESSIELARQASQRGIERFVYASCCAVYGRAVFEWLDEESPANPVSTYGETKLAAEQGILRLKSDHFAPVAARLATLYGWSPRMRFDLAVNQMVATAARQGRISVRGGGEQWRPFVYLKDAASALVLMVEAPAAMVSGEVFNTGSNEQNLRILDLAHLVGKKLNAQVEVAKDDDDLRTFRVLFDKLQERLHFRPRYSVDDGIREVMDGLGRTPDDPFSEQYFNVERMKNLLATPVDEGGEPIAARFVALAKPSLGSEEEEAVLGALRSGWLTSGPQVQAFEKAFAQTVAAPACVAVSSCTAALHLCLASIGVQPGDEVITSPITWCSTGNTILNMGARPVFVDVEPATLNMDPGVLEAAIGPRTKAIMPVHMAGHPCRLDELRAIAERHGLPVIEDAAHAFGASYKETPIGAYSPYTCFSFYAIKNITTMEGGAVTVTDPDAAERVRLLSTNGLAATAWERYGRSAVPGPLEVQEPGYKYALGNVNAAMGLVQLKRFEAFRAARQRIARMYSTVLSEVEEIALPPSGEGIEHAWHLYIVQLRLELLNKTRDEIVCDLRRENVGSGIHFYALHLHRYYREVLGMRPEDLPNASDASARILSIPLHPQMSDRNVHEVCAALKKVLAHARK